MLDDIEPTEAQIAEQSDRLSDLRRRGAEQEAAEMMRSHEFAAERPPIEVTLSPAGKVSMGPGKSSHLATLARIGSAIGTGDEAFAETHTQALADLLRGDGAESALNAVLAVVRAAGAQNELQGALAVQAAAAHTLSLAAFTRAAQADDPRAADAHRDQAVRLQASFATLVDCLGRLQRGHV